MGVARNFFSPLRGNNSEAIHYLLLYLFSVQYPQRYRKSYCCGSFEAEQPKDAFTQAIFVAATRCNVSNVLETPAISRRQIALRITPGLHVRFWGCNFGVTKIASSCRDKNRLCKRALRRTKTAFLTPERYNEHPLHFNMGVFPGVKMSSEKDPKHIYAHQH